MDHEIERAAGSGKREAGSGKRAAGSGKRAAFPLQYNDPTIQMPTLYRTDLARALADFVAGHRGLRFTRTFGMPAAYAGRRMFACVRADGVGCRLPPDAVRRELKRGAVPFTTVVDRPQRGATGRSEWVFYRPARGGFGRDLARVLEEGARYAAALSLHSPAPRRTRRAAPAAQPEPPAR